MTKKIHLPPPPPEKNVKSSAVSKAAGIEQIVIERETERERAGQTRWRNGHLSSNTVVHGMLYLRRPYLREGGQQVSPSLTLHFFLFEFQRRRT